ncbi:MAG TPA: hypothetical protein VED37_16020 [Ktedonobacteraceae bacterium]|nr:hypothetical protein [Ktedonobacteraceae bacterium]
MWWLIGIGLTLLLVVLAAWSGLSQMMLGICETDPLRVCDKEDFLEQLSVPDLYKTVASRQKQALSSPENDLRAVQPGQGVDPTCHQVRSLIHASYNCLRYLLPAGM